MASNSIPAKRRSELIDRVADYYRQRFAASSKARDYLAKRGIADPALLSAFNVGYCDGSLRESLKDKDELVPALRELGLVHSRGELLRDCVVFPLHDLV